MEHDSLSLNKTNSIVFSGCQVGVSIAPKLDGLTVRRVRKTGLTGVVEANAAEVDLDAVEVDPMALEAFEVNF